MRVRSSLATILLALTFGVVVALQPTVFAQGPADPGVPGGPFSTAFRVQNQGSSNATCTYQAFNSTGGSAFSSPLPPISPGSSAYVYTPAVPGFPSGVFAATISCDQPVAAVVNYSDSNSGDSFVGISSPATKLYVPTVYDNYYNYYTSIRLMNAGTSNNNVTVRYYDGNTPLTPTEYSLLPNGSVTIMHEGDGRLAQNKAYSAVIEGTGPLAAIVQIYGRGPKEEQLYAYTAFSGGTTKAYVPLVMSDYYGYDTATTVQNVGNIAATITITYSNNNTQNVTLGPGASHTFLDFNILPPSRTKAYSAVIESSQPIIVTVNESQQRGSLVKLATTYEGFSGGATKLVAPIIMRKYYGYTTSITCQNIGAGPAQISVEYKGTVNTSPIMVSNNLPANQSVVVYQGAGDILPNGFIGSAVITSDQNIICVVNQSNEGVGATQDQLYSYNAIPQP
ncbi:hypothetical protein [Chloroflexus sp.]|uniref:hypothetical protein n=1 Tax=Chloroflexus sp. TaxID=1904827 RepID=UPI00404935E9